MKVGKYTYNVDFYELDRQIKEGEYEPLDMEVLRKMFYIKSQGDFCEFKSLMVEIAWGFGEDVHYFENVFVDGQHKLNGYVGVKDVKVITSLNLKLYTVLNLDRYVHLRNSRWRVAFV